MKTVLVIAQEPALAAALRAALDPERYRIAAHVELWECEELVAQGVADVCIIDAELTDVQPIRTIKQVRRLAPTCPILIYSSVKQWEWEEEAYLLGVAHILSKPVRGLLVSTLLERLWLTQAPPPVDVVPQLSPRETTDQDRRPHSALQALRDLSGILTHSLRSESLLRQFLLLLREILGVNRAAIFLRQPAAPGALSPKSDDLTLRPACAIGLSSELLDHLVLSTERGIGRYLYRSGRILKNGSDEARADLVAQKEFALLGAQVAIPILDRESLIGLAVFDGRLTGEFFANEELALIFHLLEGVGLAIKNSWLHDQLSAGHEMLTDMLNELGSGCVVVDRQLKVVHANPAAIRLLSTRPEKRLDFADLPQEVGSQLFLTLQSGAPHGPFKFVPPPNKDRVYEMRITPFKTRNSITANAVLLLVDDITQRERMHALELETAALRLTQSMSSQLAHAIGNSLVPIVTHEELRARRPDDHEALSAVAHAASEGIRRISRLSRQMRFLADAQLGALQPAQVRDLVAAALDQAKASHGNLGAAPVHIPERLPAVSVFCDREKLVHALAEIILNALQSSPPELPVQILWRVNAVHGQKGTVTIDVEDQGPGFSPEAVVKATEPFYSTRNTGLGIGLTAAHRIIQFHNGTLTIGQASSEQSNTVSVQLPMSAVEQSAD